MVSDFGPLAPEANAEFVAAMEDVLDVYKRPRDEEHPVVCADLRSDGCPKQLIGETRTPITGRARETNMFDTSAMAGLKLSNSEHA